jgi:hypothetical protein
MQSDKIYALCGKKNFILRNKADQPFVIHPTNRENISLRKMQMLST